MTEENKRSRKGKAQPNYGDTVGEIRKMLQKGSVTAPQILKAKPNWTRSVVDYAISKLKVSGEIRLSTEDIVDRPDGQGKMRVKIWELVPEELRVHQQSARTAAPNNVRIESNVALLDELTSISDKIAALQTRRAMLKEQLASKLK